MNKKNPFQPERITKSAYNLLETQRISRVGEELVGLAMKLMVGFEEINKYLASPIVPINHYVDEDTDRIHLEAVMYDEHEGTALITLPFNNNGYYMCGFLHNDSDWKPRGYLYIPETKDLTPEQITEQAVYDIDGTLLRI